MKLVKIRLSSGDETIGCLDGELVVPLSLSGGQYRTLTDIFEADDPAATVEFLVDRDARPLSRAEATILPPIDRQEVWAAGVTYQRSRTARMEESAGAADFYDRVYEARRPELFFKANPHRVVGPGQPVRIRKDAKWNVPEPELTLVLNSRLHLVGFTAGNDMSSRDIEGENPLYLPQAKVYDACCALGPCVTLLHRMPARQDIGIQMVVRRGQTAIFEGSTRLDRMVRSFANLIEWLGRDNRFPHGAFLMTGTGIVPEAGFTLAANDVVEITIDGIGTLSNPVIQG